MVDYKNKRGVKHSSFLGQIDYVVYSEYIVWEYASITGNLLFNIIIISHLPVLGVGDFSFYWYGTLSTCCTTDTGSTRQTSTVTRLTGTGTGT